MIRTNGGYNLRSVREKDFATLDALDSCSPFFHTHHELHGPSLHAHLRHFSRRRGWHRSHRNRCRQRCAPQKRAISGQVRVHLAGEWGSTSFNGLSTNCLHRKAFDALIHFSIEGSFLYLSTFGKSVNTSTGFLADICEYLQLHLAICRM